jgi:hypothetical protein
MSLPLRGEIEAEVLRGFASLRLGEAHHVSLFAPSRRCVKPESSPTLRSPLALID